MESSSSIKEFVQSFFAELNDIGMQYCVERNYEGLPYDVGNDLDILIDFLVNRFYYYGVCCILLRFQIFL